MLQLPTASDWALDAEADAFLEDLSQRCFAFFNEQRHELSGLIPDRCATDGSNRSRHSSVAACGFGLAAMAIAERRGWIDSAEARTAVKAMLRSLVGAVQHHRGVLFHFVDVGDGHRLLASEASTVDTALCVVGALTASEAMSDDAEIVQLSDTLYRRVEWSAYTDGDLMSMGFLPGEGLLPYHWEHYSELMVLLLLAIGAPQHAVEPRLWDRWRREPILHFRGQPYAHYPPLFVHQYTQAYFDFRGRPDQYLDYYRNSQIATLAQIEFQSRLAEKYPAKFGHYGEDLWGLTASDSATGYRDWGGPYNDDEFEPRREIDGTLVPSAAGGALAILPRQALHTLMYQKKYYGKLIYGRYGFTNAYNPATGWVGPDVIGIDTGITLLMAENLRSGFVWETFGRNRYAQAAMAACGFADASVS